MVAALAGTTMVVTIIVTALAVEPGDAADLLRNPWGVATVIDLYLALGLGWAWIAWRERSVPRAAAWALLLVTTGSIALWAYVAWAASTATSVDDLLRPRTDAERDGPG